LAAKLESLSLPILATISVYVEIKSNSLLQSVSLPVLGRVGSFLDVRTSPTWTPLQKLMGRKGVEWGDKKRGRSANALSGAALLRTSEWWVTFTPLFTSALPGHVGERFHI
jgi:hypothetical protein